MTLKERLKQLKAGADRQASELGHENAAGAAKAGGRVAGGLLWKVVAGTTVLAGTSLLRMLEHAPSSDGDHATADGWRDGHSGYGFYVGDWKVEEEDT